MKKINKIKSIVLLFMMSTLCFLCGVACQKTETVEVELVAQAFRPNVYVNQEYDVMDVLEEYDETYQYELTELFYLDKSLDRTDITPNGTKFVQKAPYDVYVTLKITNGEASKEFEFILDVEISSTEQENKWMTAWSDTGVSKKMSADEGCVAKGSQSALQVTYTGTNNPKNDGINIGSIGYTGTYTSWDNLVVTSKVYNPNNFDMQIGLIIIKNNTVYNGLGRIYEAKDLKAGEWTEVVWSFRSWGLNFDLMEESITYSIKVRIKDTAAAGLSAPYNWKLYFCDTDLTDYSSEKFPGLETRTPDEIIQAAPGDMVDKYLVKHVYEETRNLSMYGKTVTTGSVKLYEDLAADSAISTSKPADLAASTSYVQYEVAPTGAIGNYYFCPVDYSSVHPITDGEAKQHTVEHWENVFISFYVYNDTDIQLKLFTTSGSNRNYWGGSNIAIPKKTWTKVTISVVEDYGIIGDFRVENFKIFAQYAGADYNTEETYQDFKGLIYIDGFTLYSEKPQVVESNFLSDFAVQGDYVPAIYNYFFTSLKAEKSQDKLYNNGMVDDENTVKYTVSSDGSSGKGRRWFVPMAFSETKTFASLLTELGVDSSTVGANTYIKFYVKNTAAYEMRFTITAGTTRTDNSNNVNLITHIDAATQVVSVGANSDWTLVELSLADVYTQLLNGNTVSLCAGYVNLNTSQDYNASVYYMGGFEIYNM